MNKQIKAATPSLYVLVFESEARFSEIREAIKEYDWAGETIEDFETAGLGRLYAAIVLNEQGAPTHVCRMVRRQIAGLNRRSVGISELEAVSSQDSSLLKEAVSTALLGNRKKLAIRDLERLSRAENEKVIQFLEERKPVLSDLLRQKGLADDRNWEKK